MPTLYVRNVPEDLYQRLQELAAFLLLHPTPHWSYRAIIVSKFYSEV